MQIREIWPFLLPGAVLQVLMQILYIVKSDGVRLVKAQTDGMNVRAAH